MNIQTLVNEMADEHLGILANALAMISFRSGSLIEDLHCEGKIKDSEMKQLNKYAANELYTFLKLLSKGHPDEMRYELELALMTTAGWDKPEFTFDKKAYNAWKRLDSNKD